MGLPVSSPRGLYIEPHLPLTMLVHPTPASQPSRVGFKDALDGRTGQG